MKTIKPILFLLVGMSIAFLVSFKNEEPQKEHATLTYYPNKRNPALVFTSEGEVKRTTGEPGTEELLIKTLNYLGKKGWSIKFSESLIVSSNPGLMKENIYDMERVIYLERTIP